MSDHDIERFVDSAFAEFRTVAGGCPTGPGVADVQARARRRRTVRATTTSSGLVLVLLVVAGVATRSFTGPHGGPEPAPPATTGARPEPAPPPPTAVSPPGPPATSSAPPTRAGDGSTSRPPSPGSSRPEGTSANLSVSVTRVTLSPLDGANRREGSLGVRVDNAGPADVDGLTVELRLPDGYQPTGRSVDGSCVLSGSAGRFRCTYAGRLAATGTVILRFALTAPAGGLSPGAADQRTVTVAPRTGTDPDLSDNSAGYQIAD